jgi:hypothetical protein
MLFGRSNQEELDGLGMWHVGGKGVLQAFGWKPKGLKLLGKPRRRLEDNIKMDLQEVGWGHRLDRSGSE